MYLYIPMRVYNTMCTRIHFSTRCTRRAVFIQNWCFHARAFVHCIAYRPRVNGAAAFPSTFQECRALCVRHRRRRRRRVVVGRLPLSLPKATASVVFLQPASPPLLRRRPRILISTPYVLGVFVRASSVHVSRRIAHGYDCSESHPLAGNFNRKRDEMDTPRSVRAPAIMQ
jgi:hypothetical protein